MVTQFQGVTFLLLMCIIIIMLQVSKENGSYMIAKFDCHRGTPQGESGGLFIADSREKMALLKSLNPDVRDWWIGLDDLESEDVFTWADNRRLTYEQRESLFQSGEPNDSGNNEDCVISISHRDIFKLADRPCYKPYFWACQIYPN